VAAIKVWRLCFWLAVVVVTVGALTPAPYLPPQALSVWDKAQHALAFALLGALGVRVYAARVPVVLLGLLVFGGLIELAQAATGWRTGDWWDWAADVVGIAMVYAGWALWRLSYGWHASTGAR